MFQAEASWQLADKPFRDQTCFAEEKLAYILPHHIAVTFFIDEVAPQNIRIPRGNEVSLWYRQMLLIFSQ